jgi:hypothetical protein
VRASLRFVVEWAGKLVEYLYLSRVPLAGLLVLWGLPAGATGALRALVIGAYDLGTTPAAGDPAWRTIVTTISKGTFVGLALCALVASIFVCARIIWELGGTRYKVVSKSAAPTIERIWTTLLVLGLGFNVLTAIRVSEKELWWQILAGMLISIGLARVIQRWVMPKVEKYLSKGWLLRRMKALGLDEEHGEHGYVGTDAQGEEIIERGHAAAFAFSVVLLVAYLFLIHQPIPALVTVMMVAATVVLALGAATFFLDCYRVPLLVAILVYCAIMALWWQNDHYYRVWPLADPSAAPANATPHQVIAEAMKQQRPIVVVASAGGGIQATAWTTATLHRIGEELEKAGVLPEEEFARSVRLISGVSGGSVGGLFYAMAVDRKGADRFQRADEAAQGSGLGRAMRGLLRDDMLRAVAPFVILNGHNRPMGIYADRARELEMAWVDNAEALFSGESGLLDATLSAWSRDAMALKRPALVFNSTLVETGERLAISTVPGTRPNVGSCEFAHRYRADLAMTTAARLSATFPLISPTARPGPAADAIAPGYALPGPKFWPLFPRGGNYLHCVDGGYYENSGVGGAVEWLDDALTSLASSKQPLPAKVLFIELNAFPMAAVINEIKPTPPEAPAIDQGEHSHGTLYDLISPLPAIMNVRNSGQKAFATRVLDLFRSRWARVPPGEQTVEPIDIMHVPFYYDFDPVLGAKPAEPSGFFVGADPHQQPLSWHLRPSEKKDVAAHLEHLAKSEEFRIIKEFFKPSGAAQGQ